MLIFNEPYVAGDGTVIITVSRTGWRDRDAHPVGVYTIHGGRTIWTPAVDASRHALIAVCTGLLAAVIGVCAVLRRPPWPEMTAEVMVALAHNRSAT
ncbi:MAG: hypothetical protein WCE30_03830 [Mycobacterium sp.]